jgi:hypothetical protein
MTTAAIEYIWKAILESERSNRLQFMNEDFLVKAAVPRLAQPQPNEFGAVAGETIANTVINPKLAD